jgi:hypothetical protein
MANYKKWTETEIKFISDNIVFYSDSELANKLSSMTSENISSAMIRRQRRKLGVEKKRGRRKKQNFVENTGNESSTTL